MTNNISRRSFAKRIAAAVFIPVAAGCRMPRSSGMGRKKVAILATVVRKYSHAQHFIDRFLEGYGWQGRHHRPSIELASLYVDQFPDGDLARERSKRHGVPIYPTIEEALTLGGSKLAVDGVLIIGEHGNYPRNEKGQTLYPRYKWFKQVVTLFEQTGRAVPVFNDKHLSVTWPECIEMVEDARRLRFPLMAGSSLPVTWRIPSVDFPLNAALRESVCVCYGGVDSYDFHGLETAQCMSERRGGGETGVRAVQGFRGEKLWSTLDERVLTRKLVFSALARSHTVRGRPGYAYATPDMAWLRETSSDAVGYFVEHIDGLTTTMLLLNGLVTDFTYAGAVRDSDEIVSCQMHLPMPPRYTTLPNFFSPLVNHIEQMILTGRAQYPVERTLLTSGMTLFAVDSLHQGQKRIEIPAMAITYRAPEQSTYWRS
jgi:hypothetical protein